MNSKCMVSRRMTVAKVRTRERKLISIQAIGSFPDCVGVDSSDFL